MKKTFLTAALVLAALFPAAFGLSPFIDELWNGTGNGADFGGGAR